MWKQEIQGCRLAGQDRLLVEKTVFMVEEPRRNMVRIWPWSKLPF